MKRKPNRLPTFLRYNVVSIVATSVDFVVLIGLTEIAHLWYLFSAYEGALAGGITGFILERNWVFKRKEVKLTTQSTKYLLIWIVSIVLNTGGLYLMVELSGYQYIISKIIVSVLVGVGFNYLMHKYYIFK
ncbi:MAG: polysaccharide biosynthesis protein GtrA [Bacteroidetes bacterium HGW-Bacteroidetes-16]|jgi:putative flippase GtrA|nr:MAG: polysaccharide biosynthesis protein GtrA [Bacteroidetes bacterium HGW-Bacteroidetes-16]